MQKINRITPHLLVFSSIIFCIFCYWKGLNGPWLFDDIPHLLPLVQGNFNPDNWQEFILNNSGPLKRPVAMASFIMNALLNNADLWWWKFTNLMIHILTGISIFWLTALLFSSKDQEISQEHWLYGSVIAGIWLLHPLHVSTVLYTVQRMTQLSALFVFLALLSYIVGRKRQIAGKSGDALLAVAFILFMPLGIFSKENALLIPLYMLLIEIFLLKFKSSVSAYINEKGLKILLILPILIGISTVVMFFDELVLDKYIIRDFTIYQRLITEFRILVIYLSLIVIPVQRNMGLLHDDIILSKHLFDPPETIASLIGILLILVIAWRSRTKYALFAFGIFFFFSAHLIESTIFPLELMFEHRNYFASYGIILALLALLKAAKLQKWLISIFITGIFTTFGFTTYLTADTWSSTKSLYNYVYEVHPKSRRIVAAKAKELANHGQYDQARQLLSEFDGLGIFFQRLNISCQENKIINDIQFTNDNISAGYILDMYAINEIKEFSIKGIEKKCLFSDEMFLSILDKILVYPVADKFEGHKLFVYKAHFLWRNGRKEEAYASLEYATDMIPWDPIPLYLAAEWSVEASDILRAKKYYQRAEAISDMSNTHYSKLSANVRELIEIR